MSASVVMTGEPWSVAARPPMTTYRTAWRSSAAMISAGWKLVSPTRGQTPDGSRRRDESNPTRESLQALVGRETQALLDEAHVVVLGVLDLSTQSVLDRGLVGAGVLGHGASVLQAMFRVSLGFERPPSLGLLDPSRSAALRSRHVPPKLLGGSA